MKRPKTTTVMFVLTEYLSGALEQAEFDKLADGTFAGRIPPCPGVVAFGASLNECERALRSTLEDWLLLGLRLGHSLPVVGGIDLNKDAAHATVESVQAARIRAAPAAARFPGTVQGHQTRIHGSRSEPPRASVEPRVLGSATPNDAS